MTDTSRLDVNARSSARTQMGNEFVRGLFIVNGGGAVALLTLLPSLWKPEAPAPGQFDRVVLAGLALFALGTVFTTIINYVRPEASQGFDSGGDRERGMSYSKWHTALAVVSIACFAIGCAVLAVGGMIVL